MLFFSCLFIPNFISTRLNHQKVHHLSHNLEFYIQTFTYFIFLKNIKHYQVKYGSNLNLGAYKTQMQVVLAIGF